MTESFGRPAYQQVADDLRRRITSGEFPVGSAIPSTAKLTNDYGVSVTVVRGAVSELRSEGVLAGQPGKGVFVRATPKDAAERAATVQGLSQEIRELQRSVEVLRAHLVDLYLQLGKPYPEDDLASPDAGHHRTGKSPN